MIKKIRISSLNLTLVKYIVISAILAVIVFNTVYIFIHETNYKIFSVKETYESMILEEVTSLQNFINHQQIKVRNIADITEWNKDHWYIYIKVYDDDDELLYNSLFYKNSKIFNVGYRDDSLEEYYSYTLKFIDKDVKVEMLGIFDFKNQSFILCISILASCFTFIVVFLILFSKKLKYISEIEKGIDIIKSGSLEYQIEVKGNDEISALAKNINEMSKTLEGKIKFEEKIKNQNYSIITMLSHDIRTPLTSVICYLDLIKDNKYDTKEKLQLYVKNAREKAYQIRNLTEDLFAHSVEDKPEKPKPFETVNAREFLSQLLFETAYIIEDEGFKVDININVNNSALMSVDLTEFRRIIDNISSNIEKYADKNKKVSFDAQVIDKELKLSQRNGIAENQQEVESYGIGLNSCKKIIKSHNGRMECGKDEFGFWINIFMPVI